MIVSLLATFLVAGMFLIPPIAQDQTYHNFADRRGLLGIAGFFNITTNLGFLVVGMAGIILCATQKTLAARWAWITCFSGVVLVCFGSGYYHLAPNNGTLVWDRLPMSVGFMALTVAVLADYINPRLEKKLLIPAIALGLGSVLYWHYTDDLRAYVMVQFLPLLLVPVVLLLFRSPPQERAYLFSAVGVYMLSKLAEHYDRAIYILTGEIISGHSLKHLLAALALFVVYMMLRRRARHSRPAESAVRS